MDGMPIENGHSGFSHEKWWIFPSFFVCLPQGNPNISRVLQQVSVGSLDFQGPGTTMSGAIPTASRIARGTGNGMGWGPGWGPGYG